MYFAEFAAADKKQREALEKGLIEELDYKKWRKEAILQSKNWSRMRDQLAQDYKNADKIARQIINGDRPEAFALAHNFATYQVEDLARVDTSYTLYNRETVAALIKDDPTLLPPMEEPSAAVMTKWHKGQIQSATLQSVLQGDSIDKMAQRITRTVGAKSAADSVRYARTAMNTAEQLGKQAAFERAVDLGINVRRQWEAVFDGRTRHEHRLLDGQIRPVDEPFEVDGMQLMYPGDFSLGAPGYMIWNCRCNLGPVFDDLEDRAGALRSNEAHDMSYDEWKEARPVGKQPTNRR